MRFMLISLPVMNYLSACIISIILCSKCIRPVPTIMFSWPGIAIAIIWANYINIIYNIRRGLKIDTKLVLLLSTSQFTDCKWHHGGLIGIQCSPIPCSFPDNMQSTWSSPSACAKADLVKLLQPGSISLACTENRMHYFAWLVTLT